MIAETSQKNIESLLLENLMGGKEMKGSVYHLRGICKRCKEGDKNEITHKHQGVSLYLGYLQKKYHKLYGKEKGKPFKDGIDAWIYLREIQAAIEDETFIPWNYRGKVGSETLFENFFDKFKEKYSAYRKYLHSLLALDLQKIDRIVIKKFYRNLPSELKTSSKNCILQILHSTLSEAYQEGLIDFIPAFPRKEKAEKPVKTWLSWDEQMAVIEAVPKKYQLLFLFLACHGKRISEALSLKWEDIDFKQKAVRVYEHKVKTEQWLPLHEDFLKALPFAGAINKSGLIFYSYTNATLNSVLLKACQKIGVKKVTTHEFGRHSFASQRLNNGYTREEVALVLNNWSSMKNYSHMELEQKRKIINSAHILLK